MFLIGFVVGTLLWLTLVNFASSLPSMLKTQHVVRVGVRPCLCLSGRSAIGAEHAVLGRSVGVFLIQDFEPEIDFEGKTERVRTMGSEADGDAAHVRTLQLHANSATAGTQRQGCCVWSQSCGLRQSHRHRTNPETRLIFICCRTLWLHRVEGGNRLSGSDLLALIYQHIKNNLYTTVTSGPESSPRGFNHLQLWNMLIFSAAGGCFITYI